MEGGITSPQQSFSAKLSVFFVTLITCSLLTAALLRLEFESSSPLAQVLPIVICTFSLGYWLPKRYGSLLLSIAALTASYFFVGLLNMIALALIMSAYVSVFYLFKKTSYRIICGILLTSALAILRYGYLELPFVPLAAPIAGTMIMFRFALMIHEHHYNERTSTWWEKFSYLFMLPSLAFPLFPIIDYKSFLSNYNPNNRTTLATGITRIAAGILFLMMYRILYLYVIPSYAEVDGAAVSFGFMLGSYLYILNILGVLWIGVGYLGVLGFELPPVFHYVFLIDNFRDIWRRINIYWRDFVVKLVYYPLYFKLRKKNNYAILITALVTLCISAILHGWQWFWLQGTIAIQGTGIVFWSILGVVISINLSIQKKQAHETSSVQRAQLKLVTRALRVSGMLVFMSFMWSLWNSTTISEWLHFLSYFSHAEIADWLIIGGVFLAIVLSIYLILLLPEKTPGYHFLNQPFRPAASLAIAVLLLIPTFPVLVSSLPVRVHAFVESVSKMNLTAADRGEAIENYYNRMLSSDGLGLRPWEVHTSGAPARSGLDEACIRRNDILVRELIPDKTTDLKGWSIITNSWGMRDREYAQQKPEGTFRIAILGASYEMGSGVSQDSVFENQLENMLSDSFPEQKIEILNFAVGGYHLPQQVWVAEHKIAPFQPDLVLCFVHPADATRNSNYMSKLIKNGTDLHYAELFLIKKESGAEQYMSERELQNRLYPYSNRIASWSLSQIAEQCTAIDAEFQVVYIPAMVHSNDEEYYVKLFSGENSDNANFSGVVFHNLSDIFTAKEEQYRLKDDVTHPNASGHYAIAINLAIKITPYLRNKYFH